MIAAGDLCRVRTPSGRLGAIVSRANAEKWVEEYVDHGWPRDILAIVTVPHCRCCGDVATNPPPVPGTVRTSADDRCDRHRDRNPCVVEGCRRTASLPSSGVLSDDSSVCGTHWRSLVPPGSRERRAYNAHWRRARRMGWNPRRVFAFERFWDALVRLIRRRSGDGFVDQRAIERMFGWDADDPG